MKYAFSPSGLAALSKLREQKTLFAFDFDGTLAPITNQVSAAKLREQTRALLIELAQNATVAAVSGRPVGNVRRVVPDSLAAYAGDHGAELFPRRLGSREHLGAGRRLARSWIRQLSKELPRMRGVWLEEKEYSLCVHFRESPHRAAARREVLRAVAKLSPGPRALPGKCVVNLLNPALPHKGDAVKHLMHAFRTPHALYVGDDSNDEDVFALGSPRILTVRVGKSRDSRASFYLRNQREIDRLLAFFLARSRPAR